MITPELLPVDRPVTDQRHVLTIGLEDYYQVGSFNKVIQRGQWYRFEGRVESNTHKTLDLLDQADVRATFFVLGCVADRYPEIVREVVERGHEVASKGYYHRSIREMSPNEFRDDLARSREAIERASGTKVLGFRVADGWFTPDDLWALDLLRAEGYEYDSSISPRFRTFAQQPWRRVMHQHECGNDYIWEFPVSSRNFFGWDIPIAGGNYFRQFPHQLVKRLVANHVRREFAPFVMYFHVWELDPEQPKLNTASILTRLRHYRNLDKMGSILTDYFKQFQFTGIADYLGLDTKLERPSPYLTDLRRHHPCNNGSTMPSVDEPPIAIRLSPLVERQPVSVVIPCYNEETVLPYLANTLRSVQEKLSNAYDLQFIFVDDQSKDDTFHTLNRIFGTWSNVTILRHERNQGVAAAIQTGLRHAPTEIVCSMDCDCTYDPHELANMIPRLADDVDLVTASPYHPQGKVLNVPAWRLLLSRSASFLYRRVLHQKLHTYTSCFRVYRRRAALSVKVQNTGFLGVAELLGRLDLQGHKIVEHPATLEVRILGQSKMKTMRTVFGHLGLLSSLIYQRLFGRHARTVPPTIDHPSPQNLGDATVPFPCPAPAHAADCSPWAIATEKCS